MGGEGVKVPNAGLIAICLVIIFLSHKCPYFD